MILDLDTIEQRYEAHRGEVPDYEGIRVFDCPGCELAEEVPALVDEVRRLREQLAEVRAKCECWEDGAGGG